MSALKAGLRAPSVELPLVGGGIFSLSEALKRGPVALAFFKVSCPVCQYAFPFYERLANAVKDHGLMVIGVSQDSEADTREFASEFGVTFPIALDSPGRYQVSNAYGLTNVPTLFVVGQDRTIERSVVGWSKRDAEEIYAEARNGRPAEQAIFSPKESVADFRAG